ncbi:hypothetical protein D3C72_1227600 [compost metagenome]
MRVLWAEVNGKRTVPDTIDLQQVVADFIDFRAHHLEGKPRSQQRRCILSLTYAVRHNPVIRQQRLPVLTGAFRIRLPAQYPPGLMDINTPEQHALSIVTQRPLHLCQKRIMTNFKARQLCKQRILAKGGRRARFHQFTESLIFIAKFMTGERAAAGVTHKPGPFAVHPRCQLFNLFIEQIFQRKPGTL